jgi:hypothetical protein
MNCVRWTAGSFARTAVAHWRTWEEHSAIISIAGVRDCLRSGATEGESLRVCWMRRLRGGAEGEVARGVLGGDAVRVARTVGGSRVAIDRAVTANVLAGDPTEIALSVWATTHGLVTLELAGALDAATAEAAFRTSIHATLRGWTTAEVFRDLRRAEPAR